VIALLVKDTVITVPKNHVKVQYRGMEVNIHVLQTSALVDGQLFTPPTLTVGRALRCSFDWTLGKSRIQSARGEEKNPCS
jgi:hypothetical protein